MKIVVNGDSMQIQCEMTVAELLEKLGHAGSFIAVALNMTFVPRGSYADTRVREGDEIEIVEPKQGG